MPQLTTDADAFYRTQNDAVASARQAITDEIDTFLAELSPLVATFNAASVALKAAGRNFDPPHAPGVPVAPDGGKYSAIMQAYARIAAVTNSGLVRPASI